MIFGQRAISARMKASVALRRAADQLDAVGRSSRERMAGSLRALLISALSFRTMSRGVRAGTSTAYQARTSNPGRPASAMVGSSGASDERFRLVTASARSRPAFANAMLVLMVSNIIVT